eukprot:355784-Chlamydomonas_euryale.AAC.1
MPTGGGWTVVVGSGSGAGHAIVGIFNGGVCATAPTAPTWPSPRSRGAAGHAARTGHAGRGAQQRHQRSEGAAVGRAMRARVRAQYRGHLPYWHAASMQGPSGWCVDAAGMQHGRLAHHVCRLHLQAGGMRAHLFRSFKSLRV